MEFLRHREDWVEACGVVVRPAFEIILRHRAFERKGSDAAI